MAKPRLSQADIEEAARDYGEGVEPALLWAVADVEAGGKGFLPDGRPKILFEGHVFWRRLKPYGIDPVAVAKKYPDICYQRWTKRHYRGGTAEYDRLALAISIHPDAALQSTSWGMFQLMGYHHKTAGFPNVRAFVQAMYQSERQHLRAIIRWMASNGLLKRLRAKNWYDFARGYNGSGQVAYYAKKLERAYEIRLSV